MKKSTNKTKSVEEKAIEEMAKLCPFYEEGKCLLLEEDAVECDMNCDMFRFAKTLYNARYRMMPENIGEFSDGYHTFNELYHHRAVLFSVICNMFPEKAWKSKLHDTGDMYDGMFIVGIETEQGQATYHYDIEPYWDMFKVKELDKAPKYDGHTPSDAIERIGNLSCEDYHKQSENTINLPCKVGDTVYYPALNINKVLLYKVISIKVNSNGLYVVCESCLSNKQMTHKATQIGKTIFLTKGEANRFLAKMKGCGQNVSL